MKNIGILVHGRHLQAVNWEKLVWGIPHEDRLGSLSRLALEILDRGQENVACVVFGTGASEKDGLKEAEYTKQFLMEHLRELKQFTSIASHPRFQSRRDIEMFHQVIDGIHCETDSQNTAQEVANAAQLFSKSGCTEIYQISCGSHLPRCILEMQKVRKRGDIPASQRWYGIADDMTFAGSGIGDVVVLEPPHRGDDPMLDASTQMHQVVPGLFKKSPEERVRILSFLKQELEK